MLHQRLTKDVHIHTYAYTAQDDSPKSTDEAQENKEEKNTAAQSTSNQEDNTSTATTPAKHATSPVCDDIRVSFEPVALELCARRVAAESGDVRKSLEACRLAAQAAVQQVGNDDQMILVRIEISCMCL